MYRVQHIAATTAKIAPFGMLSRSLSPGVTVAKFVYSSWEPPSWCSFQARGTCFEILLVCL